MNAEGFKNWLLNSGLKESAARNRVANCRTIEREQHVDLDVCYANDRCCHLIQLLTYSREDQRKNRPPRHSIPIRGDVFNGTATYRSAVTKYVAFKDSGGKMAGKPVGPLSIPPKSKAKIMPVADETVAVDLKAVLKRFRKWLVEDADLKPNSASQYITYINKLRAAADKNFGLGWFKSLLSEYMKELAEQKLIQCSAFVEENLRNASKSGRKAWNDWRSAFHRLEEFLHDITDVYNVDHEKLWKEKKNARAEEGASKVQETKQASTAVDGKVVATYSYEELLRAFLGRLKTQSRYYPKFNMLFPTRLLTKIFKRRKQNYWVEWLKQDLADMCIRMPNGRTTKFSEVRQFVFHNDGTVAITRSDGTTFEMMTRTPKGHGIEKEVARRGLRDVSIDHIEPLEKVLRKNKDNLHGLKCLTELFCEFNREDDLNPRSEKDWVNDFYDWLRMRVDMDELRVKIVGDLEMLELGYELMDTRYNSIKGKGA